MRTASQLRQIARQRLDGKWGTSLAVSLLAALLGCYGTYFTVSYSVDSTGELFDGATLNLATLFRSLFGTDMEILVPLLSISAAIASAVGIARLIVGGAAQLGLCSYYNRLIKGETPQVSELFSRFGFFGKALLLNLYTALLTFLWSAAGHTRHNSNVSLQPCVLCPVRQSGNERYRMRERIKAAYGWA